MRETQFVVVSGPPGSGKSTIARLLAARLRLPLLGKDIIKEALMDALGVQSVEESRRLGGAAISVLLALARANGRGVLESNWSAPIATEAFRSLSGSIVEVFCVVNPAESRRRYLDRASSRHPGHFDQDRGDDWSLWEAPASQPVAGGWPVVPVDTSMSVDIDDLTQKVIAASELPN